MISQLNPTTQILFTSAARTTGTSTPKIVNPGYRGVILTLNITAGCSVTDTLTLYVCQVDPVTGTWGGVSGYLAANSNALYRYAYYPHASSIGSTQGAVASVLPAELAFTTGHATANPITFSASALWLP